VVGPTERPQLETQQLAHIKKLQLRVSTLLVADRPAGQDSWYDETKG
jgi:hypothetical protein